MNVLHIIKEFPKPTEKWLADLIRHSSKIHTNYIYAEKLNDSEGISFAQLIDIPKSTIANALVPNKLKTKALLAQNIVELKKKIKELNIHVVHCHFANVAYLYRKLKTKDLHFAVSFYGYDYEKLPRSSSKWTSAYKKLFTIADSVIAEGSNGKELLKKLACPPQKITINALGIAIPAKAINNKKTKAQNSLSLVQIASFTEKKGQKETVLAFAEANKELDNLHLTFYGDERSSDYKKELIELIRSLGLEDKIEIRPFITYDDIPNTLKKYDVFIHPSKYAIDFDCEGGAPIILLDAQVCGLPIISTLHCDIPDEVLHLKTGLLTEENDIKALSDSISHFYKMSSEKYEEYSEQAILHVMEKYDISKNASAFTYKNPEWT